MEPEKIKESILRAAKELFRKYGYHKTSVNEIAKKARIAKEAVSLYTWDARAKRILSHL